MKSYLIAQHDLFKAIAGGDLDGIVKSVKEGASLETLDAKGRPALILAVCQIEKSNEMVKLIISLGAKLNSRCKTFGITALQHAVSGRPLNIDSALTLVESGINLNSPENFSSSHPRSIGEKVAMDCLWSPELLPVLKALLEKDILPVSEDNNFSPIESAIRSASSKSIYPEALRLLLEKGLSPNGSSQSRPLHVAVFCSSKEAFEMLLEYGANLDLEDRYGMTPIQKAWASHKKKPSDFASWAISCIEKINLEKSLKPSILEKSTLRI